MKKTTDNSFRTMKELQNVFSQSEIDTTLIDGGERVGFEVWTKEKARKQLEHNEDNRNKIDKNIKKYKEEMNNEGFVLTGDCIIIDNTGNLLNGQNRLYALLASEDTSQVFVTLRGVNPETRKFGDTGRAQTNGNRTQMFLRPLFGKEVKDDLWGVLCRILSYENPEISKADYSLMINKVIAFAKENWALLKEINKRATRNTNFRNNPLVKALEFELRKKYGDKAKDFFDKCYEGGQKQGTAPWALVEWNRIQGESKGDHTKGIGEIEAEIVTIRAFDSFLNKRKFARTGKNQLTAYEQGQDGKPVIVEGRGRLDSQFLFKNWKKQ